MWNRAKTEVMFFLSSSRIRQTDDHCQMWLEQASVPAGSVPEAQEMLSDMKFRKEKHIGKNSKIFRVSQNTVLHKQIGRSGKN